MSAEPASEVLAALVTATPEIAGVLGPDRSVRWINPAQAARWPCTEAMTAEALLGAVHPEDSVRIEEAWQRVVDRPDAVTEVAVRVGCGHSHRAGRVRMTSLRDHGVAVHVSYEDARASGSGLDSLTGLLDRTALLAHVDASLGAGREAALLLLDLDRFRLLNDSYGHDRGDAVLVAIADRLRYTAHDRDVVARLGGDEFAVLCPHPLQASEDLAAEILLAVREPLAHDGTELVLTCSVGLLRLDRVTDTLAALAGADAALHVAKERGRGRVEPFDTGMRDSAMHTLRRTAELRQAARNRELALHFQPIVDLATERTVGCEGLLRWEHPVEGVLPAGDFMDLAESSGLLNELTADLLLQACDAATHLAAAAAAEPGTPPPYVAVNLSPRQVAQHGLVTSVQRCLEEHRLAPGQLMVEITEGTVLEDVNAAVRSLTQLRELGVRVALDDFGTGYSSLLRLRDLPVDSLKIDRSFVSGLTRSGDDFAIVASIVHMAATLNLTCVAEGVETAEQAALLRRLGCGLAQGYLWSPAVPLNGVPTSFTTAAPETQRGRQAPLADRATEEWTMRLHASGASLHTIAAMLNQAGARTLRGTRWSAATVARVVAHRAFPVID